MKKKIVQDKQFILLLMLCVVCMVCNISLIFNDFVWFDESFTMIALRNNIEVRMYAWAMFFVTATAVYALEIYRKPDIKRNWLIFTVMSVCAAYTHYFALAAVCFIYMFFLFCAIYRKRTLIKPFVFACIFDILVYLPWIPVFIKQIGQVREGFWIPEFTLQKLLDYMQWLFEGPFCYI